MEKEIGMNELVELIKTFDLQTIVPLGLLIWFLNKKLLEDVDKKIEAIHKDMREIREDMYKEFKFTNIRLSRVEGTVYGQDIYKKDDSPESL